MSYLISQSVSASVKTCISTSTVTTVAVVAATTTTIFNTTMITTFTSTTLLLEAVMFLSTTYEVYNIVSRIWCLTSFRIPFRHLWFPGTCTN